MRAMTLFPKSAHALVSRCVSARKLVLAITLVLTWLMGSISTLIDVHAMCRAPNARIGSRPLVYLAQDGNSPCIVTMVLPHRPRGKQILPSLQLGRASTVTGTMCSLPRHSARHSPSKSVRSGARHRQHADSCRMVCIRAQLIVLVTYHQAHVCDAPNQVICHSQSTADQHYSLSPRARTAQAMTLSRKLAHA